MNDAPEQSFKLLRKLIPPKMQPALRGLRKRWTRPAELEEPFRSVFPYTQAHPVRQKNLLRLAQALDANSVPGAIVECGVLDGGTAALMAYGTAMSGRPVHLFDSWEGLPEVGPEDGDAAMWSGQLIGSPKRVVSIMNELKIDKNRLNFHKGWFNETFPLANIDQIALLHVDGDLYDSVKLTLDRWASCVVPGGFIQIDDYQIFKGCTTAVEEYLAKHPVLKLQSIADETTARAWFISR